MKFKDGKNRCKWCNPKNDLYIKYHGDFEERKKSKKILKKC